MENDIEFGSKKTKSAAKGRRAQKAPDPSGPVDDVAADDDMQMSSDSHTTPLDGPPKPSKRIGGWGEETTRRRSGMGLLKSSTSKLVTRRRGLEDQEDERLRPKSPEKDEDSDNDIPVIPDLEDTQEEDLTTQVAVAPNVAVNRVATYRELDNELLKSAAFLTLDDIDLKLLAKNLSAEIDVKEEDAPWDWDTLFTEVTSDILTEYENRIEEEEEKEVT